jgi:Holliday junction resolvase RusA-like endonuclease
MDIHKYIITYPGVIPSLNDMYKIGRGRGGRTWLFLNPEVDDYKSKVKADMIKQGVSDAFAKYKDMDVALELEVLCVFKQNFWRRDVTNTVKATEDAVSEVIQINDNRNIRLSSQKILNDRDDKEYLIIVIKVIPNPPESLYLWSKLA